MWGKEETTKGITKTLICALYMPFITMRNQQKFQHLYTQQIHYIKQKTILDLTISRNFFILNA